MYVDGDFGYYEFIWDGVSKGWRLEDHGPASGIKIIFKTPCKPNAGEIKAIRSACPTLKSLPLSEAALKIGKTSAFTFGKFAKEDAVRIAESLKKEHIDAHVVDVPDYVICNKLTREVAQIRSPHVYEQVVAKLLENGCEVVEFQGYHHGDGVWVGRDLNS